MPNDSSIRKLFALSPYIEVGARHLYWNGIKHFKRLRPAPAKAAAPNDAAAPPAVQFQEIKDYLSSLSIQGRVLVVHSAYRPLKPSGLSPSRIVDELLELLGPDGTLAMPAMPSFDNDPPIEGYLTTDIKNETFTYDVLRSPIKTGALPSALHKKPGSIRSRHPINTMVAYGLRAQEIMQDNLVDERSLPCGQTSSWKRCTDLNALIIGLGTDLTHALTMIHVAEDVLDSRWPIPGWYRDKRFIIDDGASQSTFTLRERLPIWGALHFAERTLCKDLTHAHLLRSSTVSNVLIETLESQSLFRFLSARNSSGYPYFLAKPRAYLRDLTCKRTTP